MHKKHKTKFNMHLWLKPFNKLGMDWMFPNMTQAKYDKPTSNILTGERLKAFPLRQGIRQGYPFSPLLLPQKLGKKKK